MHQVWLIKGVRVMPVHHGRCHAIRMSPGVRARAGAVRSRGGVCGVGAGFGICSVAAAAAIRSASVLPCTRAAPTVTGGRRTP